MCSRSISTLTLLLSNAAHTAQFDLQVLHSAIQRNMKVAAQQSSSRARKQGTAITANKCKLCAYLAAHAAVDSLADRVTDHLSSEVYLNSTVDCCHPVLLLYDVHAVSVGYISHVNCRVVVHKVVQCLGAYQECRDQLAGKCSSRHSSSGDSSKL
jgi:hypothetical protein